METKKPSVLATREFREFCRRVQGRPPIRTRAWKNEKAREYYRRKHPKKVKPPERDHPMKQDPRTQCWMVGVPTPSGKSRRWLSTGEKTIGDALKVVDASGIQRLSILARANCLTTSAAQIIMAGERVTCGDAIRRWAHELRLDQARKTAAAYGNSMRQLVRQYNCEGQPVAFITREMLYDFVNNGESKESTRQVRLAGINSFYRYAAGFGYVIGNIATTIRVNKSMLTVEQRERVPAVAFTDDEYRRVMANPEVPQFWRWASALGYWLGLRIVDVCRYEWASVGDDFAVLYPQKTGRRLVLPLHDPLIGSGELRAVFAQMRAQPNPDPTYCFPMARWLYERNRIHEHEGGFRKAAALCGITGKGFHSWRHAFKVRLFASGKTIEEISKLMGHRSVVTTEGYGRSG